MLDNTDQKIIELLQQNSRLKVKELAEKISLSAPATSQRMIKLEDEGIIKKYTVEVDYEKLGYPISAFFNVRLFQPAHTGYLNFVKNSPHVFRHYRVSGEGCYTFEGKFSSNKNLELFMEDLNGFCTSSVSIIISELV